VPRPGGRIQSITLGFAWRRWPEVLQELELGKAQTAFADA
jgi:hypothetical protein